MSSAEQIRRGVRATLGEPRTTVAIEQAGAGWVGIDAQHGHFDDRAVRDTFALRAAPRVPMLVRVAANDPWLIGRALDSGADGVIVPMISSQVDAEKAVLAAHYPPFGQRSWGPLPGQGSSGVPDQGDDDAEMPLIPWCAVMVETASALADLSAIAATPGLGMIFVGPFDLSLSLGHDVDDLLADTEPDAPLPKIVRACTDAGIVPGAFGGSVARAESLLGLGFRWVASTTDAGILEAGVAAEVR